MIGCIRKRCYFSELEAGYALDSLRNSPKCVNIAKNTLNVYFCHACHCWHIGHKGRGRGKPKRLDFNRLNKAQQ